MNAGSPGNGHEYRHWLFTDGRRPTRCRFDHAVTCVGRADARGRSAEHVWRDPQVDPDDRRLVGPDRRARHRADQGIRGAARPGGVRSSRHLHLDRRTRPQCCCDGHQQQRRTANRRVGRYRRCRPDRADGDRAAPNRPCTRPSGRSAAGAAGAASFDTDLRHRCPRRGGGAALSHCVPEVGGRRSERVDPGPAAHFGPRQDRRDRRHSRHARQHPGRLLPSCRRCGACARGRRGDVDADLVVVQPQSRIAAFADARRRHSARGFVTAEARLGLHGQRLVDDLGSLRGAAHRAAARRPGGGRVLPGSVDDRRPVRRLHPASDGG